MEINMLYEIWVEGFAATGQYGLAHKLGEERGETFEDACAKFMTYRPKLAEVYNPKTNTHWGCKLFDNKLDAMRKFG